MNEFDFSNFDTAELCGWDKDSHAVAIQSWGQSAGELWNTGLVGDKQRTMLWELVRKVIGNDTPNQNQAIGDCVSFGTKNAMEYLQCVQIALGQRQQFKLIFPPYIYGISRVQIGGGRLWGDGSNGVWAAQGVMKYGVLARDAPNCPQYSGSVARSWGRSGPPDEFITIGKEHLVKSTAAVRTWDDAKAALSNGYPLTVCSSYGFDMNPRSDGFNHYSTTWGHCMACIGFDDGDSNIEPHVCILNSWGDMFGHIKDFRTGVEWPIGTLRVRRQDFEGMLAMGDSWSFSTFDGFPAQALPESYFDMLV